jgi:hypothetical protein
MDKTVKQGTGQKNLYGTHFFVNAHLILYWQGLAL